MIKMSPELFTDKYGLLDENILDLQSIVYKYLNNNIHIICNQCENIGSSKNSTIPSEICDSFFDHHQDTVRRVDDSFIKMFLDIKKTPLRFVNLRNSAVTNEGLEILLRHNLICLSLWYCDNITTHARNLLQMYSKNLRVLELGMSVCLLRHPDDRDKVPVNFEMKLPRLRKLILNQVVLHPKLQIENLKQLTHLDLSSCIIINYKLDGLLSIPNLQTLILFNVWPIANQVNTICNITSLRFLDLSVSNGDNGQGIYLYPDQVLDTIVKKLANLSHLDISGTNLAGNGVAKVGLNGKLRSDIQGLMSRTQTPLQFLGLYHTAQWACKRHDIPAIEISGEANEQQILIAAKYYRDRPVVLTKVLNDLYHLLRFEYCHEIHKTLCVVLTAMDRHLRFKNLQISGSATMFYIVKDRDKPKFGTQLKQHIIRSLLNGMEMHISDDTMLRNGYLTLTQFSMPNDVLFEYERVITILLYGVAKSEQEGFVQRLAIYLLNTLASQVDGGQKMLLGDFGVINAMINLVKDRLDRLIFDDVMEVAWSTMWNVTDETAINCKRFLDEMGMEYFLRCLHTFPDRDGLLRNMMGLLGNVAEVKNLRKHFMTAEFLEVFTNLLNSDSDGIEVSYNAAGVLAHIASDGKDAWTITTVSRKNVLSQMEDAIDRWNLQSRRNINYRSFIPILSLLNCYHTPQCQQWAAWALANLTEVYPEKYCQLVEHEDGLKILNDLCCNPSTSRRILTLAQMVINKCIELKSGNSVMG